MALIIIYTQVKYNLFAGNPFLQLIKYKPVLTPEIVVFYRQKQGIEKFNFIYIILLYYAFCFFIGELNIGLKDNKFYKAEF
jgi:hypothetical protein